MTARQIIHQHLVDHAEQSGFAAPRLLIEYLAELCAARLDSVDIAPQDSWTECYFRLAPQQMAWFGDTTLFYLGLQPGWHRRRGISSDYLPALGASAYWTAYDYSGDVCYRQLGDWYPYLQQFLESAVRSDTRLSLCRFSGVSDK